jgi:hypothetical protein
MPIHRIEIGVPYDKLLARQRFRLRRPGGSIWIEIPDNARYGTEFLVQLPEESLQIVLVPPRSAAQAETPVSPPPRERLRPAPQFSWRGPLVQRLPENPIIAGTPMFWERVREELWESVRARREFGGICAFEEREDGLLLYELEHKWQGTERQVELIFEAGELLWHTHPSVDEAADRFSEDDIRASEHANRPLLVLSFGKTAPGFLARFMVFPNIPTIVAGLSVRGIVELEKRGVIPPNLLKYGIRVRVYIPGMGDREVLHVDEEHPRSLAAAHPAPIDRYAQEALQGAQTALQGAKDLAQQAVEEGKRLFSRLRGPTR